MPSQKQPKGPKVKYFRISLVDDMTHKQLWVIKFTRTSLFLLVISVITVIMAVSYSLIAFTPLRTFIPGYPDGHTKRAAITNAIRIDSLRNVIYTWEFYTENLKRVMEGADPVAIDSVIRNASAPMTSADERKNWMRGTLCSERLFVRRRGSVLSRVVKESFLSRVSISLRR